MTAPEDYLEKALREALSAAVSQVEPAADGLDRIRARTSRRPPQPRLLSIASAVIGRTRNYVWRGHCAWREKAALLARSRPSSWHQFRPVVAVLAGSAFVACIGLALPPFREAFVQVGSTVLTGDGNKGTPAGGGATDGNGTLPGGRDPHGGTGNGFWPAPGGARQQNAMVPTPSATSAVSPAPQTSPSGTAPASPSASASVSPPSSSTPSSPTASPAGSTPPVTATASPTDSGMATPPATPPASPPATPSAVTTSPATAPAQ